MPYRQEWVVLPGRSPLTFLIMTTDSKELSEAKKALMDFILRDPEETFHALRVSVATSIAGYCIPIDANDPSSPTEMVMERWYQMLMLMGHIHDLCVADSVCKSA